MVSSHNESNETDDVQSVLGRIGIAVPPQDIAFLQRTFSRQRELLRLIAEHVQPETEPANVLSVNGPPSPQR